MDKIAMFFLGQLSCAVVCVLMAIAIRLIYTGVMKWKILSRDLKYIWTEKEVNEND